MCGNRGTDEVRTPTGRHVCPWRVPLARPSAVWGATELDPDDDAPPNLHLFRLMPYNHHMPTDRRSSFGFDATPPFHQVPTITCVPSRPFPPPPPPSPPSAPPSPPPYLVTERTDCFLGGRVTFVTTPSETPGTLWEANVHMERWLVGAQLTFNFYGDSLYAHPLRIASIQVRRPLLRRLALFLATPEHCPSAARGAGTGALPERRARSGYRSTPLAAHPSE